MTSFVSLGVIILLESSTFGPTASDVVGNLKFDANYDF